MKKFLGIKFSCFNKDDLLSEFFRRVFSRDGFGYVVTPNLDHLVKLKSSRVFFEAYSKAEYVVTDGWPVAFLTKIAGVQAGDIFPGSDLVPAIFDTLNLRCNSVNVYLLGAPPGVNEIAIEVMAERWPNIKVSGHFCPPFGFLDNDSLCRDIVANINEADADIVIVALGAPNQEIFCYRYGDDIVKGLGFCVGATTEFIAGTVKRAPIFFRVMKLEWLYRWIGNPKRLSKRYLDCLVMLPGFFYSALKMRVFGE